MTYTPIQQLGARLALAALSRDEVTMALLLNSSAPQETASASAVALAALAELALVGRPGNLTRARDYLGRMGGFQGPKSASRKVK